MHLSDGDALRRNHARLEEKLDGPSSRVIVEGPTGSGRSTILAGLRSDPRFVCVDPPALRDADAVIHALLQAAVRLEPAARAAAFAGDEPIRARSARIGRALADAGKIVALRLPTSWRLGLGSERRGSPDLRMWQERASDFLRGMAEVSGVGLVLLVSDASALPFPVDGWRRLQLGRMALDEDALADLAAFGSYEAHAKAVAAACAAARITPTPIQFRVAVGLRAMGGFADRDVDLLAQSGSSLQVLETRLYRALARHHDLAAVALRLAAARWPVLRSEIAPLTGVPDEHEPLVTECLAYGDTSVRMHERIRGSVLGLRNVRALREPLHAAELQAHRELVRYHRALDGTAAVAESPSPVDWLERTHHLAHSGCELADEWDSLVLESREFYWERGRALSLAGHHEQAAAVYRRCLERFGPDDAYAQHYCGFNLNLTGTQLEEAGRGFAKAVELESDNPWWNARLVTFHIEHSRFLAARQAWRAALEHVDPSGERVATDDWLAKNLHRWVIIAWLDVGEVALAREAFDGIPPEIVARSSELARLEERLLDAEEAVMLGESVYPASIPPAERWDGPRRLSEHHDGHERRAWYPGRVVEADERSVMLVFAVPAEDPEGRRVKVRDLGRDEWAAAADFDPAGFVEIGSYEGGHLVILPVDESRPPWADESSTHASRGLTKWRREGRRSDAG